MARFTQRTCLIFQRMTVKKARTAAIVVCSVVRSYHASLYGACGDVALHFNRPQTAFFFAVASSVRLPVLICY